MKKFILLAGILLALGGVAIASCLVMANRITANAHREFFDLVATGDADQFLEQSDQQLIDDIDAPVLEAWMQALNQSLGSYQQTLTDGFSCNTRQTDGARVTEIAGTAVFDHGRATVQLNYIDGKLAGFQVQSDQLADGWFHGPADASLYQQRMTDFLEALINDRSLEAFMMMHEALQKEVTVDSLRLMGKRVIQLSGPIETIGFVKERFKDQDGQRLTINAEVTGQMETLDAKVTFQFIGMKGHLLEFGITPREAVAPELASVE